MILMGNRKVVWEGEGCKAFPYPDLLLAVLITLNQ
jgi:hypothetical protein